MGRTDTFALLPFVAGVPGQARVCPLPGECGRGEGARKNPDVAEANCPGRWVIYEVLKSIFEAVIYLTALSLNKHRIRLMIVTVETQHPNLVAIAASPSPAHSARGPAPASAHSCTLAAASAPAGRRLRTSAGPPRPASLPTPPSFPSLLLSLPFPSF